MDSLANESSLFAPNNSRRKPPASQPMAHHGPRDPQELERRKKAQQAVERTSICGCIYYIDIYKICMYYKYIYIYICDACSQTWY